MPTTTDSGISYGNRTTRATMSQATTNTAPSPATHGIARRTLSPIMRLTMFGTTSPKNGSTPAVTTTQAVITAMTIMPIATTRR